MYTILISHTAESDLNKIHPTHKKRILLKIQSVLSLHPFPQGKSVKRLTTGRFRLRVGKYRIQYDVEKEYVYILEITLRDKAY